MFEGKFTISLIIINILIFFGSLFLNTQIFNKFVNYQLYLLEFKFYSLITAGFLHDNLTYLLGNMLGIFIFGRVIERKLGFLKTLLIYFGALIISSLFSSLIHLFIIGDNTGEIGDS